MPRKVTFSQYVLVYLTCFQMSYNYWEELTSVCFQVVILNYSSILLFSKILPTLTLRRLIEASLHNLTNICYHDSNTTNKFLSLLLAYSKATKITTKVWHNSKKKCTKTFFFVTWKKNNYRTIQQNKRSSEISADTIE